MSLLVHSWGARLRAWGKDRRLWGGAAILLVAIAFFLLPHQVSAVLPGESYLAGAIAWILGLIVSFLGKIISVLVYVLMGFLQYNGFADAQPVVMGWVIVRDFVNMLFIVVLLISAVATILNYDTHDLHVKNVLPNLIAAAVLINFSKMIVGLLVDASQVVTLTFVNAFQASGIGNFAQVLGLPNFTTLSTGTPTGSANSATTGEAANGQIIFDVLLAYMLAMAMLVISIGVILIMILFTVGRIVGLWVLLIVSPAAMFASCMPKKLQKMFGSLEHEFWEKLTGLCVGGPTMAFFLWLSFATVRSGQQAGQTTGIATRLGLFAPDQAGLNQDGIIGSSIAQGAAGVGDFFLSRIGNADGIASFIVGVALMMIGLDQAVKASGAAGDMVKGYADQIKKQTKSTASWLATRPVAAPANYLDRRLKLTDKVASSVNAIPLVDTITGGKLRKFATYRKDEMKKQGKEDAEYYGKLSGWQKNAQRARTEFAATTPFMRNVYGSDADRNALTQMNKDESTEDHYKKNKLKLASKYEDEMKTNRPNDEITGLPIDDDEIKNRAKARAHGEATATRAKRFQQGRDLAKSEKEFGEVVAYDDLANKNVGLLKDYDPKEYKSRIKKLTSDEFEKDEDVNNDLDALLIRGEHEGAFSVDGAGNVTMNEQGMNAWVASTPKIAKNIRALEGNMKGSATVPAAGGPAVISMDGIKAKYNKDRMQTASKAVSRIHDGKTGGRVYTAPELATRKGMNTEFNDVSTHNGRSSPGVLGTTSARLTDTAFDTLNVGFKELQDVSKGADLKKPINDNAMTKHFTSRAGTELSALATSAHTDGRDVDGGMRTITRIGEQFKDLDDATQTEFIKTVVGTKDGLKRISTEMNESHMSPYQIAQFSAIVRRAKELSKSDNPAVRTEAGNFIKEAKDHFFQKDARDSSGALTQQAAPKPIVEALYN